MSLNLMSLALSAHLCSVGDASTGGQQPGPGEHGAGAGGGSTAALEEAGSGAAQDGVRPAQDAELRFEGATHHKPAPAPAALSLTSLSFSELNVASHYKYGAARVLKKKKGHF